IYEGKGGISGLVRHPFRQSPRLGSSGPLFDGGRFGPAGRLRHEKSRVSGNRVDESEDRSLAGGEVAPQMVQQKQDAPLLPVGGRGEDRLHEKGGADTGLLGDPGRAAPDDWNDSMRLFEFGFQTFSPVRLVEKGQAFDYARKADEEGRLLQAAAAADFVYPLSEDERQQIRLEPVVTHPLDRVGEEGKR